MTPVSESYPRTVAPSSERRRGAHDSRRRARTWRTSDAVVSAYVHEIAEKPAHRHSSERSRRDEIRSKELAR
jgi:hypothetical protein